MSTEVLPVRHTGFGNAVNDTLTMIGRSIRLTRRNVETLLMSIALPLLMMALFVYVFGGAIETGTAYINYVVPGIILLCAGFGASQTAVSVAHDMEHGMIDRLRSMPIRSFAVLTGHVTASLARNSLATAIVFATAVLMGFRPNATALDWLLAVLVLALYILAFSWLAAAIGVAAKSVESASAMTFFMMFLPYLSSAFVPTDTMPLVLRVFSENQPITPIIETVRGLLTGTPIGSSGWLAVAWAGGLFLAAFAWATWLFRRKTSR
ncbi:ABC transporter permease [Tenggerimyces flavus]|uniref:Transport permease protein n=1 Tax=Tenggerimyces flavus TaxID=1708749 RepID=A0ABV7YGE5_9ACTN|nr:ABC transporter permease [Tenggerimyces flavus]MBM7784027.1 ABC-2 type transport system permease protein [Tenggerimyces flavus]